MNVYVQTDTTARAYVAVGFASNARADTCGILRGPLTLMLTVFLATLCSVTLSNNVMSQGTDCLSNT